MANKILDPLSDGKSRLELLSWMGGDLDVVNDAKASFDRVAESMGEREIKLLNYLIRERHTSPLRGTAFKFRVKAPLFLCRQWWKHALASNHTESQIGWNEKSFRYTEITDPEEFYIPKVFRRQSESNRQSSEGCISEPKSDEAISAYKRACKDSYAAYVNLIELGVAREQARGVLVAAVYTSWVWTTSLQSLLNFIDLRLGKGSQDEISLYAYGLIDLVEDIIPETIKAWHNAAT